MAVKLYRCKTAKLYNWTEKQLIRMSDNEVLLGILQEKRLAYKNKTSPLYMRLGEIFNVLSDKIEKEKTTKRITKLLKED